MAFMSRDEINRRIIAIANAEIEREAQELEARLRRGGEAVIYRPSFTIYPPKTMDEEFSKVTGDD